MVGSEVVTYKRKRLFLRNDHAHVDLNFDAHSKVLVPKHFDKCNKHGKSIVENVLQNKGKEVEKCGEHSITKDEENVPQGQKCVSQCNGPSTEKHESMFATLCAASTKQHDSLDVLYDPKNSVVQQITFNANKILEVSHGEKSQTASVGHDAMAEEKTADVHAESLSVKSGLEDEYKCKKLFPMLPSPSPPVAQSSMESDLIRTNMLDVISPSHPVCASVLGAYASEEVDKLNKDQCSDSRNDLSQKQKSTSVLITYKRNKRTKSISMFDISTGCAAKNCASDTPPGADCSVYLENKKACLSKSFTHNGGKTQEPPEDTCVEAPATEGVLRIEDSLHLPVGASTDALVEISQDSCDMSLLKGKVLIDDDGKDINPGSMPGDASEKRDSVTPLELSLTPHASHDIDCNRPLDENFLTEPSEVRPDSVGLEGGENTPKENSSLLRAVINKGKSVVDQPPALTGTSSKHNCLQLFPENMNAQALQLANHLEMVGQLGPSSSLFHGVSVQPEVMTNGHAAYAAIPELPYLPVHYGQSFHDFLLPTPAQSFPRHQMLLDNILTRARAARGGSQSSQQTTWSEEELDSLWIGVRRHGRGNWEVILGDRRLHFSPRKTSRDLAEKWQQEQSQLFSGTSPPQDVQLSLGYAPLTLYNPGAPKRPPIHFMNIQSNRLPQEMYTSAGTLGSYAFHPGTIPAGFPNWLRDPSGGIPPRPSDPAQARCHPGVVCLNQHPSYGHAGMYFQPGLYSPSVPVQQKAEPQAGGGRPAPTLVQRGHKHKANKLDSLIVIPSGGSSEETISDDLTLKA